MGLDTWFLPWRFPWYAFRIYRSRTVLVGKISFYFIIFIKMAEQDKKDEIMFLEYAGIESMVWKDQAGGEWKVEKIAIDVQNPAILQIVVNQFNPDNPVQALNRRLYVVNYPENSHLKLTVDKIDK